MPDRVRLFLAVALPEDVRAELERAQLELRQAAPEAQVRWTKPEQFHLTLKFLGNVATERIESLTGTLRQVCQDFAPLHLRAQEVGSFPDWRNPRVIWVGIHDTKQTLLGLQSALEAATQPFSTEQGQENFTGHVTLGRVKRIDRPQAKALAGLGAGMSKRCFWMWCSAHVDLMQSDLGPSGARHTTLARLPLRAPTN